MSMVLSWLKCPATGELWARRSISSLFLSGTMMSFLPPDTSGYLRSRPLSHVERSSPRSASRRDFSNVGSDNCISLSPTELTLSGHRVGHSVSSLGSGHSLVNISLLKVKGKPSSSSKACGGGGPSSISLPSGVGCCFKGLGRLGWTVEVLLSSLGSRSGLESLTFLRDCCSRPCCSFRSCLVL